MTSLASVSDYVIVRPITVQGGGFVTTISVAVCPLSTDRAQVAMRLQQKYCVMS